MTAAIFGRIRADDSEEASEHLQKVQGVDLADAKKERSNQTWEKGKRLPNSAPSGNLHKIVLNSGNLRSASSQLISSQLNSRLASIYFVHGRGGAEWRLGRLSWGGESGDRSACSIHRTCGH